MFIIVYIIETQHVLVSVLNCPHSRGWKQHKYWLLDFFRSAVSSLKRGNSTGDGERRETLFQLTAEAVGEHLAPNFALLLLWASQANAVPVSCTYV